VDDAQTLKDSQSFIEYFLNTFAPEFKSVFKEVAADIQS